MAAGVGNSVEERLVHGLDARDLGLVEHDLGHEHRPAVAGGAPWQFVAAVLLVPGGERGGASRHYSPQVIVTTELGLAWVPAAGFCETTGLLVAQVAWTLSPAPVRVAMAVSRG